MTKFSFSDIHMGMNGDIVLMSTRSMSSYASQVAYHMLTFPQFAAKGQHKDFVGKLRTMKFADGEMEVDVRTSIRGKDVYLFGGSARNSMGIGVEEGKIETYHAVDALKRAAAGSITLIEPYYSSSRSDRTTRRNSVGFWVHYKTLIALGVNHLITYQLHSDKSKTAVDPTLCAIDDIPAMSLIMEYLATKFVRNPEELEQHVKENWLFCSVDAGGETLARKYAEAFGTNLIIAHKHRDYKKANVVEKTNILSDTDINGKEVWIVDDMIDTGSSVVVLVRELKKRGVKKVNIAIVHAVFSDPATERLRALHEEGLLDTIVATDTVEITDELKLKLPFLHVVSSARQTAEVIVRLNEKRSLSEFFDSFSIDEFFRSLKLFF